MLRKLVAVVSVVIVAASFAVASAMASEKPSRISVAKRTKGSGPPLVTTPTTRPSELPPPHTPESPPPDTPSLPPDDGGPGPSAPPPAAPPPPEAPPEMPLPPPAPTPTTSPVDEVRPDETVRPSLGVPADAPVRLPQTGDGTRPLTATAGVSLLAAGLAVIAGARHRAQAVSQPGRRR